VPDLKGYHSRYGVLCRRVVTMFHAANETNKHIPKKFNLFHFAGEECEDEILLLLCSYHVPQVLNAFHNNVPNRASIYPKSFAQSSPLLPYIGGAKGGALHPHIEIVILGSHLRFSFLWLMGQSKWPIVNLFKNRTWEAAHPMNRRAE